MLSLAVYSLLRCLKLPMCVIQGPLQRIMEHSFLLKLSKRWYVEFPSIFKLAVYFLSVNMALKRNHTLTTNKLSCFTSFIVSKAGHPFVTANRFHGNEVIMAWQVI